MDNNLIILLAVLIGLGVVALLYTLFYRERSTDGTDELNWVNDTNYNPAGSDEGVEAAESATPAQAAEMVRNNKANGPYPPSEREFHALSEKLSDGPHDTETVREQLSEDAATRPDSA